MIAYDISVTGSSSLILLFSKVNQILPCFNMTCKSKGSLLTSLLIPNLSLNGMVTEVGKLYFVSIQSHTDSFQSISNTHQIQFLFNAIF